MTHPSKGSVIERQRRAGWYVRRIRIEDDPCSLCGEPWTSEHVCAAEPAREVGS